MIGPNDEITAVYRTMFDARVRRSVVIGSRRYKDTALTNPLDQKISVYQLKSLPFRKSFCFASKYVRRNEKTLSIYTTISDRTVEITDIMRSDFTSDEFLALNQVLPTILYHININAAVS